jgi:hypothetical protein
MLLATRTHIRSVRACRELRADFSIDASRLRSKLLEANGKGDTE